MTSLHTLMIGLLSMALWASCGTDAAAPDAELDAPLVAGPTRTGKYHVTWKTADGSMPFNETFPMEVEILEEGQPVIGAILSVRCEMPAHAHGMKVVPTTRELGAGRYLVEGMLLHMKGEWELGIDIVVDNLAETADFPLLLE